MRKAFLAIIPIAFVFSCARQTSPTGGPKDTIPPILIKTYPKKEQTNFKENNVVLTFDELILVENPKEQIIIIPDINKEYEISSRKNTVKLTFKNPFLDSTTYSINFRESVKDLTEKNPARNLKLAFSTGSYVDSLFIGGSAYHLLQGKPLKDITVALYQSDTFNIFTHKPTYLTKSDDKGNFIIENLKAGTYYAYAIDDKNRNLVADSKTELYGFLKEKLELKEGVRNLRIPLIRLDSRPLKLTSKRPYNTYYNIKTTKGLESYTLTSDEVEIISSYGEDHSNIRVYNTFPDRDSVLVKFQGIDSIQNQLDTAFYIQFSKRESKPEPFAFTKSKLQVLQNKATLEAILTFTKPLQTITFDSIYYQIDSLTLLQFAAENFTWSPTENRLTIQKKIDKQLLEEPTSPTDPTSKSSPPKSFKSAYTLNLRKGAFISIENDSSKQVIEASRPIKLESTGSLLVQVETNQESFIVQLFDRNFNVLQSKADQKKCHFEDLPPGDYQLGMVIDSNKDGKWSPGNFFQHTEPEEIIFYSNEKGNPIINLKANFEIELLITH